MQAWRAAAAMTLVLAALAQPASAQINPFRSSFANGLGDEDFDLLSKAASSLLARDMITVGATEAWRNPRSGAGGTVTVMRNFKHASYECHTLLYETTPDQLRTPGRTRINWCKTDAGWRIYSR